VWFGQKEIAKSELFQQGGLVKVNENNMNDKTDWAALKKMTESEIELAAKSDPDAPLLSDYELSQFKRVKPVQEIDVREIRTKLHLSQEKFAIFFGVSKRTIQEWEQHRKRPNATSRNFLRVVEYAPDVVQRALAN
jgi:putative transcriptional regulator